MEQITQGPAAALPTTPEEWRCLTEAVCQVARSTGTYLREARRDFRPERVEQKHARDFVSYVDREAERRVVTGLRDLLPGAGFLTEEQTVAYGAERVCWVVDPLDGTTNFIHDVAPYAVSIALRVERQVVLGVVCEACRDECFYAWQDGGVVSLNSYTYSLTINVRSYETVNFTTSGDMTAGVSGEFILMPTDGTFKVSEYDWYATGLAPGLNIGVLTNGNNGDNQGKLAIYGMTAKSDDEIKMDSIKIVGRDAYGNEYWATLSLTISATPEITYTITVGGEEVDPATEGSNVFLFESGGTSPVLTVTTAEGDDRAVTISVVDPGTGKRVDTVGKTLTLDISEVGRYVVEMTVYFGADSTTTNTTGLTTTAVIEVVPNITGAGAGFIVLGGN